MTKQLNIKYIYAENRTDEASFNHILKQENVVSFFSSSYGYALVRSELIGYRVIAIINPSPEDTIYVSLLGCPSASIVHDYRDRLSLCLHKGISVPLLDTNMLKVVNVSKLPLLDTLL